MASTMTDYSLFHGEPYVTVRYMKGESPNWFICSPTKAGRSARTFGALRRYLKPEFIRPDRPDQTALWSKYYSLRLEQASTEPAAEEAALTATTRPNKITLARPLTSKSSTSAPSGCDSPTPVIGLVVCSQGRTRADWNKYVETTYGL